MTQRPSLNCESMSRVEEKQFYFFTRATFEYIDRYSEVRLHQLKNKIPGNVFNTVIK